MNDRQFADLALTAAQLGSQAILRELRGRALTVENKAQSNPGDGGDVDGPEHVDFVTSADKAAEQAILDAVWAVRPDDAVLAEESGVHVGTSGVRWVIDPLDGTTNFVHSRRDYAVSVGVERDGDVIAGAIVRPADGDWAVACPGYALGRDSAPRISDTTDLGDVMLGIGLPRPMEDRLRVQSFLSEIVPRIRDYRRTGSSACSLLDVAYGREDVSLNFGVNPWDVAGGLALVEAAGGIGEWVTTASGLSLFVAGAPTVCRTMIDIVKEI